MVLVALHAHQVKIGMPPIEFVDVHQDQIGMEILVSLALEEEYGVHLYYLVTVQVDKIGTDLLVSLVQLDKIGVQKLCPVVVNQDIIGMV